MGDIDFPGQHTTTTVTSNTTVQTNLRYDPSYVKTIPGMLKIAQVALNLLGYICIMASGVFSYHSRGSWFIFVSMTGFWFTGILLAFYLFHCIEKFFKIPWLKIEFVFCVLWSIFYLIASCLAATFYVEAYSAAAFFGFCAMVVYAFDAYIKFRSIQNGELAQGERVISKEMTTTVTTPTY